MVCNIGGGGGQLGTKVVISALGMLALYMRFNRTGIWGGETIRPPPPYIIVLASSVTTMEVKAIGFHRIER